MNLYYQNKYVSLHVGNINENMNLFDLHDLLTTEFTAGMGDADFNVCQMLGVEWVIWNAHLYCNWFPSGKQWAHSGIKLAITSWLHDPDCTAVIDNRSDRWLNSRVYKILIEGGTIIDPYSRDSQLAWRAMQVKTQCTLICADERTAAVIRTDLQAFEGI